MSEHDQKQLEDFHKAIEPYVACYGHATFSYLSLKKGDAFELIHGRLALQGAPVITASRQFQSANIKAGIFRLGDMGTTVDGIIESLFKGKVKTPQGELNFPSERDRSHSVYFNPFHVEAPLQQNRQMQLYVRGDRREQLQTAKLDWEVKAAPTPFDNLRELCDDFAIGPMTGDSVGVEILAFNVAVIGVDSSVHGTKTHLVVHLANGLDPRAASIGYRTIEKNLVTRRGTIPGESLHWTNGAAFQRGETEFEVPAGAVLQCFANFAGQTQHYYWVADPSTAPNPFRAVHEAFDSQLTVLQELVAKAQSRGAHARDLEVASAWLLWILGFSVTHIGGTPKTSEAPDLIATTPQGHFLVVECTTGLLKEDHKLPHLVARTERIRQSLAASGNQHLHVLPLMVTTKTRDELKAELEHAHEMGVLVATKDDFPQVLNRTILFPDANRVYAEAEEALRRLQNPPTFPPL